jgi:hypothetical protein
MNLPVRIETNEGVKNVSVDSKTAFEVVFEMVRLLGVVVPPDQTNMIHLDVRSKDFTYPYAGAAYLTGARWLEKHRNSTRVFAKWEDSGK